MLVATALSDEDRALVEAYLRYTVAAQETTPAERAWHRRVRQETGWALRAMLVLTIRGHPDRAWAVTADLLARAPDDRTLALLAAGPLERLLIQHGPAVVDRVVAHARRDARFRKALRAVWGHERMNIEVRRRVLQAVENVPAW